MASIIQNRYITSNLPFAYRSVIDALSIPIASSSRTPFIPAPRKRTASIKRRFSNRASYTLTSSEAGIAKIPACRIHGAYSSTSTFRNMSSIAQPLPNLSTSSIPFPSPSSSSGSSQTPTPISHHGLLITPPILSKIQEEGYLDDDIQLIPQDQAWINVTPEAIKVSHPSRSS